MQSLSTRAIATIVPRSEPGETLDGEGGATVCGTLVSAARARELVGLPIGLAGGLRVSRRVPEGATLTWADVKAPAPSAALALRRQLYVSGATSR